MLNKLCLISASKNNISAVVCSAPIRAYHLDIREIKNPDPANLKRGTGGRSSFNGNVVTVFGATGFLGKYICNQLGKRGCQLIIPHRSDPDDLSVKRLKLVGDLGQVLFQPFDLRDRLSIRKAIKYSNVVINLIGRDFETSNFSYRDVHVKGAREIAMACKEFNVERLIHFSSLNVTETPKRYYLKKLDFLPSKLEGEQAVFEEFPNATVFRPALCYGVNDRFLWAICNTKRNFNFSIPLYKKGEATIKQPVFAIDVAQGVINAMNNSETKGKIYQIVGPQRFYLKDIAEFCSQVLQRHLYVKTLVHDVRLDPTFFFKVILIRYIIGYFQHMPMQKFSFEQIEMESVTDVVDQELPLLSDLGVPLSKLEDKIPYIIYRSFKAIPSKEAMYKDLHPVDSLSAKAL